MCACVLVFVVVVYLSDIEKAANGTLGLHAFTGCDALSAFWRRGKV